MNPQLNNYFSKILLSNVFIHRISHTQNFELTVTFFTIGNVFAGGIKPGLTDLTADCTATVIEDF